MFAAHAPNPRGLKLALQSGFPCTLHLELETRTSSPYFPSNVEVVRRRSVITVLISPGPEIVDDKTTRFYPTISMSRYDVALNCVMNGIRLRTVQEITANGLNDCF
jgi:hypothetical protein